MIQVRLDNGQMITVDTDDPQAAAKAGRRYQMRQQFDTEAKQQHASQDLSLLDRFLVGTGRGFSDTIQGVKQLGLQALGDDEGLQRQQQVQQAELQEFNKIPGSDSLFSATGLGRLTGGIASTPVPAARGASLLGRLAQGAGAGAVAAGSQFVPEGGSRLKNAALGAGFGVAGQGLAEGVGAVANKVSNARAGNVKNADVLRRANAEGVPLGLDDLSQNPALDRIGTLMDRVPFLGSRGSREATQDALDAAITRRIADVGDQSALYDGLQASAKRTLKKLGDQAGERYDDLAAKLDPKGAVDLTEYGRTLLKSFQDDVLDDASEALLQKFGAKGASNFTQARNLRRNISDHINRNLDSGSYAPLVRIKKALEDDMKRHATDHGGGALWKRADDFYRRSVLPVKTKAVKKAVFDQDSSKVWKLLSSTQGIKRGDPAHASRMYKLLDADGRKLARQGMFKEAYEAATKQGEFSPAVMHNQIQARQNIFKEFAKTDDIDGLVKLLAHTKKAGRIRENPPTGNRVMDVLLFGGALAEPVTAASSLIIGRFLFFNPRARNFLLAVNKQTPGTAAMQKTINQFSNYLIRSGALTTAQPEGEQ